MGFFDAIGSLFSPKRRGRGGPSLPVSAPSVKKKAAVRSRALLNFYFYDKDDPRGIRWYHVVAPNQTRAKIALLEELRSVRGRGSLSSGWRQSTLKKFDRDYRPEGAKLIRLRG
jgi:hypothetical protein